MWNKVVINSMRELNTGFDRFYTTKAYDTMPHWHDSREQRLIFSGKGTFVVPTPTQIVVAECSVGDLVWLDAKTIHWFYTAGEFGALRFFSNEESRVEHYNDIPDDIMKVYNMNRKTC